MLKVEVEAAAAAMMAVAVVERLEGTRAVSAGMLIMT